MAELVRHPTMGTRGRPLGGREVGLGAVAGLAGGLIMGIPMAMMGMLPAIAGLVRSDSAGVGVIVHMVISAVIGGIYGAAVGTRPVGRAFGPAAVVGLVYAVIWWVLGPLAIMPLLLGMGLQFGMAFSGPLLLSLMGHLTYGVVTALAFAALVRRA